MQLKGRHHPPPSTPLCASPIKTPEPALTLGAVEFALGGPTGDALHPTKGFCEERGFLLVMGVLVFTLWSIGGGGVRWRGGGVRLRGGGVRWGGMCVCVWGGGGGDVCGGEGMGVVVRGMGVVGCVCMTST